MYFDKTHLSLAIPTPPKAFTHYKNIQLKTPTSLELSHIFWGVMLSPDATDMLLMSQSQPSTCIHKGNTGWIQ